MEEYKIYLSPEGILEAVQQGWSWPGFIFNCIWALANKMWLLGGVLIAIFIALFLLIPFSSSPTVSGMEIFINIVMLITATVFGFKGNEWKEIRLKSRGYECKGSVKAYRAKEAITAYLKHPVNVNDLPS